MERTSCVCSATSGGTSMVGPAVGEEGPGTSAGRESWICCCDGNGSPSGTMDCCSFYIPHCGPGFTSVYAGFRNSDARGAERG
jgi:hypothetical protein